MSDLMTAFRQNLFLVITTVCLTMIVPRASIGAGICELRMPDHKDLCVVEFEKKGTVNFSGWDAVKIKDEFDDKVTSFIMNYSSDNTVASRREPPYILIACNESSTSVAIKYQGGINTLDDLVLRFDKNEKFALKLVSDVDHTTVVPSDYPDLFSNLLSHDRLIVKFSGLIGGTVVAKFELNGLDKASRFSKCIGGKI